MFGLWYCDLFSRTPMPPKSSSTSRSSRRSRLVWSLSEMWVFLLLLKHVLFQSMVPWFCPLSVACQSGENGDKTLPALGRLMCLVTTNAVVGVRRRLWCAQTTTLRRCNRIPQTRLANSPVFSRVTADAESVVIWGIQSCLAACLRHSYTGIGWGIASLGLIYSFSVDEAFTRYDHEVSRRSEFLSPILRLDVTNYSALIEIYALHGQQLAASIDRYTIFTSNWYFPNLFIYLKRATIHYTMDIWETK